MFLQNVCCAFCAWLSVWAEYVCMAACLSVYLYAYVCVCAVAVCVCVWLEILSMLYYAEAQKTQRLIRETYQTLALSDIDSLSVDRVDRLCPG